MAIVVPVDTGNKQMKTPENIFTSGFTTHKHKPGLGDTLFYNDTYYTLSEQRLPQQWDKTGTDT